MPRRVELQYNWYYKTIQLENPTNINLVGQITGYQHGDREIFTCASYFISPKFNGTFSFDYVLFCLDTSTFTDDKPFLRWMSCLYGLSIDKCVGGL